MSENTNINSQVTSKEVGANAPTSSAKKNLTNKDIIVVKALVPFVCYSCPSTHDSFLWADTGDTQEMTFAQLKIMAQRHRRYFTEKWLIPLNDEAINKLQLKEVFNKNFDMRKDMKSLYGNDVNMVKSKISYVAESDLEALKSKIIDATKQGKIVNIKILRVLEARFDLELMDLI